MLKKALITGIEGFTGRYLASELAAAGYEVHGFTAANESELPNVIPCDILDAADIQRAIAAIQPDVVCHLAAIAFVAHGDVDAIYKTNVLGTRNLLAALASSPVAPSAVALASSSNIYGNATTDILREDTPAAPANDYAVSKLAMEHMAMLWAARLPLTLVRPFNYTGVGQSAQFLIPKIVDHFRRKAPVIELGNLDVVRDFLDVRTVAYCYRRLVETAPARGSGCEAFNTCSAIGISLHDVLQMMREISGHDLEVRVNPAFVRSNEVKTLIGTRAKLESAIGAVQDIPFYETLEWMYHAPVVA